MSGGRAEASGTAPMGSARDDEVFLKEYPRADRVKAGERAERARLVVELLAHERLSIQEDRSWRAEG